MKVMMRKMLNNSLAATILALKIACNPPAKLFSYTQATSKVPSKAGRTTPRRNSMVPMIANVTPA